MPSRPAPVPGLSTTNNPGSRGRLHEHNFPAPVSAESREAALRHLCHRVVLAKAQCRPSGGRRLPDTRLWDFFRPMSGTVRASTQVAAGLVTSGSARAMPFVRVTTAYKYDRHSLEEGDSMSTSWQR